MVEQLTLNPGDFNGDPMGYSIQTSSNNGSTWNGLMRATGNIPLGKEMIAAEE